MQLHADSDDAYLVAPKAKYRVGGYFYLSDNTQSTTIPHLSLNTSIHVECALGRNKWSFYNCKAAIPIVHMLLALGHS